MAKQKPEYDALTLMTDIFNDRRSDYTRQMNERIWFRNILYYMGDQWLEWWKDQGTFKKRARQSYVPTPVANKIRDACKSERALILNKNYVPRVWPNSNEPEDREAARIAQMVLTDMDLRNDEEFSDERESLVDAILLFGTAFMRTFPDLDRGEYGVDKNGDLIKSGEVVSEALSPFNVVTDPLFPKLRQMRYTGVHTLKLKEWIEDTFETKIVGEARRDELQYNQTLLKYISNVSSWKGTGLVTAGYETEYNKLAEFKELEFKPTKTYPRGRYIVMANDQILLDVDRLPMPGEEKKGEWYYTITDFHYNKIPAKFWSDAFVNDLLSPQDQVNSIDQSLEMNRRSVGRPRVSWPTGSKLTRKNEQGEAFIAIEYDPRLSGGVAPKFENGVQLGNQVLTERAIHEGTIQDSSGNVNNVLRGQAPTSDASGVLVEQLQETAEASHGPDITRIYRGIGTVHRKRLILAKELYTEKRIIKVVGPDKEISIKNFRGADLRNNTDVRMELASGIFRTKASEANALLTLVQQGLVGTDPVTRGQVFRKLGMSDLVGDDPNVHVKRAEKEEVKIAAGEVEGIFVTAPDPETGQFQFSPDAQVAINDPFFKFDDHKIHLDSHTRFILSDNFKDVPAEAGVIFMAHTEIHKMIMEADAKNAQMEAVHMQAAMAEANNPPKYVEEPEAPPLVPEQGGMV